MDIVKKKLDEVVISRIDDLENIKTGSEEEAQAIRNIAVLCEARNADSKRERNIDRIIRYAFDGATFVVGLLAYGKWYKMGLEFEKEGTFTTKTVLGLTKLFKPFWKK